MACLAVLALSRPPYAGAQEGTAAIAGRLLDRETRTPVAGAALLVVGTARAATTDSAGRFEFRGLPRGTVVLRARAIGYTMASWVMDIAEGETAETLLEMEARPIQLPEVTIEAELRPDWRSVDGFLLRRSRGRGYFITQDDIERRHAVSLADLLRTVPGVITTCTYRGCVAEMGRSLGRCRPEYFLDGFPATLATGPDFPAQYIGAVEVYNDASDTPLELQRAGLRCGVIVIWTKGRRAWR